MVKYKFEKVEFSVWCGPDAVKASVWMRPTSADDSWAGFSFWNDGMVEVFRVKIPLSELEKLVKGWENPPEPHCSECGQKLPEEVI